MSFDNLIEYIASKHNCHTIILYGSYSKGNFDDESDIDVIGFTNLEIELQDKSVFEGVELDLWIYNDAKLKNADEFLHVRSGKILLSNNGDAQIFLKEINELFNKGPIPQSIDSKMNQIAWLEKMLKRTQKRDLEGKYRLNWLLTDLLPMYFELIDRYYLGSKESFEWLKSNDTETFNLFEKVYNEPVETNIKAIIQHMRGKITRKAL